MSIFFKKQVLEIKVDIDKSTEDDLWNFAHIFLQKWTFFFTLNKDGFPNIR